VRPARPDEPRPDRVRVSSDAQVVTSALSAGAAPAVRPEKVEQARKALAAGLVGADVHQLADTMIDSLLGR
jgi:anti-sigma28 factor (negative regulator of flagellin synthesis)